MNFEELTVLQLLYAALGSVLVAYVVTALIDRAIHNHQKPNRRKR